MHGLPLALLLAASAARVAPVPAGVIFGSADPGEQRGHWVAPEVVDVARTLPVRPVRVVALTAPAAPGCDELYRFRLVFAERSFANLSGFRSAAAAEACRRQIELGDPAARNQGHRAGAFYVRVTPDVARDARLQGALFAAADGLSRFRATALPPGQLPAGAPDDYRPGPRPPPPMPPRRFR